MPQLELAQTRQVLAEAMGLHRSMQLDAADEKYAAVVDAGYRPREILPILVRLAVDRGELLLALTRLDALLALDPRNAPALGEKGALLHRLRKWDDAVACLTAAVEIEPDNTHFLSNLGAALADAGRKEAARRVHTRLLEIDPGNPFVQHQVRRATASIVPFWHIPMLNDEGRNRAFETAIKRAVAEHGPDALVLDVGTGSGLLSMMAARAGARRVVTCESVPTIADTARRIIARNGLEAQITVIDKRSNDLVVGQDLPCRASILVSEVLSSDILAEDVLPTFEDAKARLLTPDAAIIPRSVRAVGCLVESDDIARYAFVRTAAGFDVSLFTELATQRLPLHGPSYGWRPLSDVQDLVAFDLTADVTASALDTISIPIAAGGVAVGVLQWLEIALDAETSFSTEPPSYVHGGWQQILHTFPNPISVAAGETLSIAAGHDRTSLILVPIQGEP